MIASAFWKHRSKEKSENKAYNSQQGEGNRFSARQGATHSCAKIGVPQELYKDFMRLGLTPGAPLDACKVQQKKLLKKHHPDMNCANAFSVSVATDISASINAAFQRIAQWYKTGTLEAY